MESETDKPTSQRQAFGGLAYRAQQVAESALIAYWTTGATRDFHISTMLEAADQLAVELAAYRAAVAVQS